MKIIIICLFFVMTFTLYALTGDVDNNGSIDIIDALKIAQYYVGMIPSLFNKTTADVNTDNAINIIDALLVAQYSIDLIPYFPSSTYKRLPVPFTIQETNMCGPACAMMYTNYKKITIGASGVSMPSQTELYNSMRKSDPLPNGEVGVTYKGLYSVLNELLYKCTIITSQAYTRAYVLSNSTATDTRSLLAQMALINNYEPSIVLWRSTNGGHFVVMVGYDADNNRVLYNEPEFGKFATKDQAEWLQLEFDKVSKTRIFIAEDY